MAAEIIWTDQETGQRFIIDDCGEKIFILADGSRVYESDLILEEMLKQYEAEEEERRQTEEAEEILEEIMQEDLEIVEQAQNDNEEYLKEWVWEWYAFSRKSDDDDNIDE